jgi:hypothetical protein
MDWLGWLWTVLPYVCLCSDAVHRALAHSTNGAIQVYDLAVAVAGRSTSNALFYPFIRTAWHATECLHYDCLF